MISGTPTELKQVPGVFEYCHMNSYGGGEAINMLKKGRLYVAHFNYSQGPIQKEMLPYIDLLYKDTLTGVHSTKVDCWVFKVKE